MALFRIGQRIVDTTENARGTVKYLGEFSKFVINVHLQETSKVKTVRKRKFLYK